MKSRPTKRLAIAAMASVMGLVTLAIPLPALASGGPGIWSLGTALHTLVEPAVESLLEGAAHGTPAKVASEVVEAVAKALMVGEIAGKIVTQLGYEVTVDTEYQPEDGPVAIHLQDDHTKDLSDRSILLKAKVEFKNDWESKLPAPTLRKILGMGLPEQGAAKHATVNWEFPAKLKRYTVVLPGDFNGGTNPTWTSKTGADGVATGMLHPVKEDFSFGGVKRVEEMKIKVTAQIQAAQGLPHGVVSAVAPLVDKLLGTAQGTGVVRIERHVPTEWEGSFEMKRTVSATWSVKRPIPPHDENHPLIRFYNTYSGGKEDWSGILKVPKMHFTTAGLGSGDYEYRIDGSQTIHQERKTEKVQCESDRDGQAGPVISITELFDMNGKGDGTEFGTAASPESLDDPEGFAATRGSGLNFGVGSAKLVAKGIGDGKLVYAMSWTGVGAGLIAIAPPRFAGRSNSTRAWTDCEGPKSIAREEAFTSRLGINKQMVLNGPITPKQGLWLPFDPSAKQLSGTVTWSEKPMLGMDAPAIIVTTTMSWNIKRIMPK